MTPRSAITLCILVAVATTTACNQPTGRPKQAKAAKIEAKFVPENPNFPQATALEPESPQAVAAKEWWNSLKGEEGRPIEAANYAKTAMLSLPFGAEQLAIEAALPGKWRKIEPSEPIYDPTLLDFTSTRYRLPEVALSASLDSWAPADATLGFNNGHFGDLRLLFTDLPDGGQQIAETLIAIYGLTQVEKAQEPDPAAKTQRKTITLTWRVAEEGKRSGFISYQVTYGGPTAGDADHFLRPDDRFIQSSFTTMSPDMMTALRAAHPVGSGGTP